MRYCAICKDPEDGSEEIRYEVIGWEQARKQGGTNALELRKRTGAVAHARCVNKTKRHDIGQTDIFDAE